MGDTWQSAFALGHLSSVIEFHLSRGSMDCPSGSQSIGVVSRGPRRTTGPPRPWPRRSPAEGTPEPRPEEGGPGPARPAGHFRGLPADPSPTLGYFGEARGSLPNNSLNRGFIGVPRRPSGRASPRRGWSRRGAVVPRRLPRREKALESRGCFARKLLSGDTRGPLPRDVSDGEENGPRWAAEDPTSAAHQCRAVLFVRFEAA